MSANHPLLYRQSKIAHRWQNQKLKMNRCIHLLLTVIILTSLPYSSTLSLPNGDPAPGRSPGPPGNVNSKLDLKVEDVKASVDYEDSTIGAFETTTVSDLSDVDDACAFARISSDSEDMVTLSAEDSDVNLTITHPVFETNELVKGVVYDGIFNVNALKNITDELNEIFDLTSDKIMKNILGDVTGLKDKVRNRQYVLDIEELDKTARELYNDTDFINETITNEILRNRTLINKKKKNMQVTPQPIPKNSPLDMDFIKLRRKNFNLRRMLDDSSSTIPIFKNNDDDPEKLFKKFDKLRSTKISPELPPNAALRQMYHFYGRWQGLMDTRQTKIRLVDLQMQFLYMARFKMTIMSTLRRKYKENPRFKIGYCFSLLRQLRLHQRLVSLTIMNFPDTQTNNMIVLKMYAKVVNLDTDIKDLIKYLEILNHEARLREDPHYYDSSEEDAGGAQKMNTHPLFKESSLKG